MPNHKSNSSGELSGECDVCGEEYDTLSPDPSMNEVAEFYDPMNSDKPTVIAHAECGLNDGLDLA